MKKISALALMTIFATSATFAQDLSELPIETQTEVLSAIDTATEKQVETNSAESSNPRARFPHGIQLGVGVSATSGLNGFVGYVNKDFDSAIWKRFGVRFDFATTSPIKSTINSAIDSALDGGVDVGDGLTLGGGRATAQHFGAMVDFYPFGDTWFLGGIRISGGYMTGKMDLSATLTGKIDGLSNDPLEFELNGQAYRYTGNSIDATADANWKYAGPYLGAGFDLGLFAGFKIYMDAGVVFTSKTAKLGMDVPTVGLQQWNTVTNSWDPVTNLGDLNTNIDQATRDANDELADLKFFPMVKLGFMYRF